jgi:putative NIF3 family GTP cyclohydrolase 1 type 2
MTAAGNGLNTDGTVLSDASGAASVPATATVPESTTDHGAASARMTVGELEAHLLQHFPASDAESWDRTGMLVGDRAADVTGVCVALDPTVDAIRQTQAVGANVLLTHHPLFLDPPTSIEPPAQRGDAVGARVWQAIAGGVSVLSFHTALDVSAPASLVLPGLLGLRKQGILEVVRHDPDRGYGQICTPEADSVASCITFDQLAARCQRVFHSVPRVWGPGNAPLRRIVTCTGAAGDDLELAVAAGIDCVVAGEVRYHKTLDAVSRGLCVIELGHDISEHPLCSVLVSSVLNCGIDSNSVRVLDRAENWRSGTTDDMRRI